MAKRQGFQCKQFFVAHDKCGMKVGTDSLILGSWANCKNATRILDIGAGSGLLSLMAAQQSPCSHIDAIEIEENAALQARENADQSPWSGQIQVHHSEIACWRPDTPYDVILSNPPYFYSPQKNTASHDGQSYQRQLARSESGLSLDAFCQAVERLLSHHGHGYFVLPSDRVEDLETFLATSSLYITQQLWVKSVAGAQPYLSLFAVSKNRPTTCLHDHLTIYNEDRSYTSQYKSLCCDYYLNF